MKPFVLRGKLYRCATIPIFFFISLALASIVTHSTVAQVFSIKTNVPMSEIGETSWASSWGDFDNDYDDDLYVSNYYNQNFLYRNDGNGKFTKISNGSIVLSSVGHWASTWVDYDNDRDLDLYVINSYTDNNELLRNNDNGTFTSVNSVITNTSNSLGNNAAWSDTDRDGDLDLFIATGSNSDEETRNKNNLYYINNGDGTFTKNTTSIIATDGGFSQYGCFSDYDNDGDPDLLVINTFQDNFFYENNGEGSFTKVFNQPFLSTGEQPLTACWGDLNNDGYTDLVIGSYNDSRIYFNNGDKSFRAKSFPNISGNATGVSLGDFNNDGYLDVIFIRTGQNALFYLNNGDESFSNINAGDLTSVSLDYTNSGAVADYDKDGNLDVFVNNDNSTNLLFENKEVTNNWIGFRLVGRQSNWQGIGAKVMIKVNNEWQTREIATPSSYRTQNSVVAHFGLRSASCIEQLRVVWPSGKIQNIYSVRRRNIYLTIDEAVDCYDFSTAPMSAITNDNFNSNANAWADYDNDGDLDAMVGNTSSSNGINLYQNQADSTFLDVAVVTSLAGTGSISGGTWGDYDNDGDPDLFVTDHSTSGLNFLHRNDGGSFTATSMSDPGISVGAAWADLNNDGALDLIIANNQTNQSLQTNTIYLGNGNGILSVHHDDALNNDKGISSGNVALADVDGDHDVDIFIPTIGTEKDILYRNDGHAKFEKDVAWQEESVPSSSYSAAFGDYDNDGDDDLYVSGDDILYRNDGHGMFTNVVNSTFNNKKSKQALWGDHDNDGDLDLFLVKEGLTQHELYQNEGDGTFTKAESFSTLSEMTAGAGSWVDVNNDGYLDLFLANDSDNKLFLNSGGIFNSIRLNLIGITSNRSGIGATIKIKVGTQWQSRQVFSQSSGSLQTHFGLGEASHVDILRVEWPSGNVQILKDIDANQLITVTESNSDNAPHSMPMSFVTKEEQAIQLTREIITEAFVDSDGDKLNSMKVIAISEKLDLMLNGMKINAGAVLHVAEFEKLEIHPKQNMNGLASFIIETTDYRGLSVRNDVNVSITPVNDAPVIRTLTITERYGRTLQAAGKISDIETSPKDLSYTISSANQAIIKDENISMEIHEEDLTLIIIASAEGSTTLRVNADDGETIVFSDLAVDVINIPHTLKLSMEIGEDETLSFNKTDFATSFKDSDGDQLKEIKLTQMPSIGNLMLKEAGVTVGQVIGIEDLADLKFQPFENFSGAVLIPIEVIDLRDLAVQETVTVQVWAVNDAPQLMPISDIDILAQQIHEITTISLEAYDIDTPAASLIFSIVSDNQDVVTNTDLTVENTTLSVRPSGQGEAKITVTVSDGEKSFSRQFIVNVNFVTAIEEETALGLNLYPNPVTMDHVVIIAPDNSKRIISYRLIDAKGILVSEQNITSSNNFEYLFVLPHIRSGIYTIICTIEDHSMQTLRFVKR
jgi:hypothetical protein